MIIIIAHLSGPSMASMTWSAVERSRLLVRLRWWLTQICLALSMAASSQVGSFRNMCTNSSTDCIPPSPVCTPSNDCGQALSVIEVNMVLVLVLAMQLYLHVHVHLLNAAAASHSVQADAFSLVMPAVLEPATKGFQFRSHIML